MHTPKSLVSSSRLAFIGSLCLVVLLAACSINQHEEGKEKKVDITTPVGGLHVSNNVDPRETGLSVYPGARVKPNDSGEDNKSANVNISTDWFGLKVVVIQYESNDAPDKVIAYYKSDLKQYGNVLECHTADIHNTIHGHHRKDGNKPVTCEGDNDGNVVELKVGTEDNQHLVAVKPEAKGSSFALVYVQTRGDETI